MTGRSGRAATALWIATVAVSGLWWARAGAEAPAGQGWWTAANSGAARPPDPPDVPADGLLVQGGGGGSPTAYAALLYELPSGTAPRALTLSIAPSSAATPLAMLEVCPLRQAALRPEQGGAITDAPAYDCSMKATASPGSGAKDYRFDLSRFGASATVAVAILPTAPTDRVVFTKPDAASLATQQPVAGSSPAPSPTAAVALEPSSGSELPAAAPAGTAGPATGDPASPAPSVPSDGVVTAQPASSSSSPGLSVDAGSGPSPSPATSIPPAAPATQLVAPAPLGANGVAAPWAAGLVVGGLVGSGALWAYAGRQRSLQP